MTKISMPGPETAFHRVSHSFASFMFQNVPEPCRCDKDTQFNAVHSVFHSHNFSQLNISPLTPSHYKKKLISLKFREAQVNILGIIFKRKLENITIQQIHNSKYYSRVCDILSWGLTTIKVPGLKFLPLQQTSNIMRKLISFPITILSLLHK